MFRTVYWNLLDTLREKTELRIRDIDVSSLKTFLSKLIFQEIVADSAYLFFNSNPYLDFPFPSLTKCVPIGGFSMNVSSWKESKISENLEEILQERSKTVYISFGSVIRSADMPNSYKEGLISVFRALPDVTFIWKYEEDDEELKKKLPGNVHLEKWLPQPALLGKDQ